MLSSSRHRRHRATWLVALVWSSLILALVWGVFFADPQVRTPGIVIALGTLWVAGMAAIILVGYRFTADTSDPIAGSDREFIYRLITRQTKAAIGIVNSSGRFSLVNENFCEILGWAPEELIGQRLLRFVHPEDHAMVREQLRLRRQGHSSTYQIRVVRKDGEVRWILAAVSPLYDSAGRYCGGLGLITDITKEKLAEQALREYSARLEVTVRELEAARRQAQEALKTKDHLLASVTHELRTPLAAILGYAETLLIEGDLSQAPPTRIAAIQTILRNGKYLLQIINDLLELAKAERSGLSITLQDVSPLELVQDVLRLMEIRANAKGLPLRLDIRGPIPRTIKTDPVRLRQILINLLGNAIKFTEAGSVRLVMQALRHADGTCSLQFEVIDTGIGIPAELCEKIFEPFHRADPNTNRAYPGCGLGLALSRNLARRLGGDITVVSEVGIGSNFRLTLPLGAADQYQWLGSKELLPCAQDRSGQGSGHDRHSCDQFRMTARVLIVDDCPDTSRLFAHILRLAGAEVVTAGHPRDAIRVALQAMVEDKPFDCILLDMQMPEVDGYQVTRILRKSGYSAPIIALTANNAPGEREKCLLAGCDDFATKPLSRCLLLKLVGKYAAQISGIPFLNGVDGELTCQDLERAEDWEAQKVTPAENPAASSPAEVPRSGDANLSSPPASTGDG